MNTNDKPEGFTNRGDEKEDPDWQITPDGLYIATRHFLIRRGYCCANQCRNCPYINWRNSPTWQPIPEDKIQRAAVSPKSFLAAQRLLAYHERLLQECPSEEQNYHRMRINHYRSLLQHWRTFS